MAKASSRLRELVQHPAYHSLQKERPIAAELLRSVFERVDVLFDAVCRFPDPEAVKEFNRMSAQIYEISSWFSVPLPLPSPDQLLASLQQMHEAQMPPGLALQYFELQKKRRRGRPTTGKSAALHVLDLKETKPAITWAEVAQQLCSCGKLKHDKKCAENLRREVNHLKKFLRKYGILRDP